MGQFEKSSDHGSSVGGSLLDDGARIELFALNAVRLLPGEFKQAQEVDRAYMLRHDADRLLAPFRREAGLAPKAEPYGNWESCGLDGHTAGHYLSALAMMWAATGDVEIKRRMDRMVAELGECQEAGGDGYVGGIPNGRALWNEIGAGKIQATGFSLNGRWVPWYNLHKLFAGLRDAWVIGGNERARDVLIRLCDWCVALTGKLDDPAMAEMLRCEHGGMNDVLAEVSSLGGDERYLAAARRFSDRSLLQPLIEQRDVLSGLHANTQIPKVIGFTTIAALANEPSWWEAAQFFWQRVRTARTIAIGGNSVDESFRRPDDWHAMLDSRCGVESCNTNNMLRLTERLFVQSPQAHLVDFYEQALFNHILGSQHPALGGFVYFTPMRPRHYRVYSQAEQGFWCCVGTGFENHARYGSFIYAHRGLDELFVNLFIASSLDWAERGVRVEQTTRFPDASSTRLVLSIQSPASFTLHLRHPRWTTVKGFRVRVNGEDVRIDSAPGSFVSIRRCWHDGDQVEVEFSMELAFDELNGAPNYLAVRYGPVVLAARAGEGALDGLRAGSGRGDHIAGGPLLPLSQAPVFVGDNLAAVRGGIIRQPAEHLTFVARGLVYDGREQVSDLVPFYRLHDSRYMVYWRWVTPDQYAHERERIAGLERHQLALDQATIDMVNPGRQQSEVDHGFESHGTRSGDFSDRSWRGRGGWFSYQVKRPAVPGAILSVMYHSDDAGHEFDILVDGAPLTAMEHAAPTDSGFYTVHHPLDRFVKGHGRATMTVRLAARDGSSAGRVFELRVLRHRVE